MLNEATTDPAAMEKLIRRGVVNGGLWFDDAACQAQFKSTVEVPKDQLAAFARCLVTLHLQPSKREDGLGDVAVMTYAPGFEVEVRIVNEVNGPHLLWLGYASRAEGDRFPTITADALERVRLTGDRNGPLDPDVASTLELDPTPLSHAAFTWIKVCLDASGTVTSTTATETTSSKASLAFVAAAASWKFRPFTLRGQPVPVCSMVRMAYPAGQGPAIETLPLPAPPSKGMPPIVFAQGSIAKFLKGKRIRGTATIVPNDMTKLAIREAGAFRIIGTFRLCVDSSGRVESVLPTRSTGFADYDRKIIAGMMQWAYSPYTVNGVGVAVCTAVTFIYSQGRDAVRVQRTP